MTKIITTNINLEDEIRTIKALEAKLEELKEHYLGIHHP